MVLDGVLNGGGLIFNTLATELTLLAICVVISVKIIKPAYSSYHNGRLLDKIAGTSKAHWFYGNMREFGVDPHERCVGISKLSSEYPVMVNSWRGPLLSTLVVFHPDVIRSIASSGAPKDDMGYKFLRPWLGDGLLTSKGSKWKRNRILLTPAFHFSVLKPYMQISNQTVRVLIEKWKKKINQPLEISNDVSLMTLDTMVQCAMSTKTNCQLNEDHDPYIKAVQDIGEAISSRFSRPLYLIDWIYRMTSHGRSFYKSLDVLHFHAKKIISDRKKKLEEVLAGEVKKRSMRDFLDILLQTKDEEGKGLTDQEVRDEVDTFLFEGHDTTSSGISWALYNLAKYPEFQEKCREEIQSVCRGQEDIEWDDLNRLPYFTMFLKESFRLCPPVSGFGRKLEAPLTFKTEAITPNEITIPSGSRIAVQIIALHRHPVVWEKPEEFIPERFTKENSSKRHPHAYIPFSSGSRNCIGQNFAMNEVKVCLAQVLRNFQMYLDEETPTPKMRIRLTLQSMNGIHIKLRPLEL